MPEAQVGSPEWWRDRLLLKLDEQAKRVAVNEAYVDGRHPLPEPPKNMHADAWAEAKRAFETLSKLGVTNLCPLIAKAPSNRLQVVGFQFGEDIAGDADVWRTWQTNHLDADSRLVHDTALQTGQAFVLVWPGPTPDVEPSITCEHPSCMIVAYEQGSRWKRAAALKRWTDESGRVFVTLYTPEYLFKWQTRSTRPNYSEAMGSTTWDPRTPENEPWPLPNPLGMVPVVEFAVNVNLKPRPFGGGHAEFEPVLSIQDRVNKTVFDRLVTAESQAFRQRYTIGWEIPLDPETNQPDPRYVFKASRTQLANFPEGTTVGDFAQADFSPFMQAVEDDVRWMAVITNTPPAYLPVDMKNLGADTLTQTNAGYIAKTQAHRDGFGESWEEVARLALTAKNDPRAADPTSQVMWRDIEVHTLAEVGDFIVKLRGTLPLPELLARVPGSTPQSIKRWMEQLKDEQPTEPPVPAA